MRSLPNPCSVPYYFRPDLKPPQEPPGSKRDLFVGFVDHSLPASVLDLVSALVGVGCV